MPENNSKKIFGISNWSVKNSKTVFLIIAILFLGGIISYQSMPKENFPELEIPEIYIGIAKPGSSPAYMSDKIAEAIEKEITSIKKVDEINATSQHGYTTIRVKFDFDIDVNDALSKVKDAVDQARSESDFPELPVEPNIFEVNPSDFPIMNINLSGKGPKVLKEIGDDLKNSVEEYTSKIGGGTANKLVRIEKNGLYQLEEPIHFKNKHPQSLRYAKLGELRNATTTDDVL